MSNDAKRNIATIQKPYNQKYSIVIPAAGAGTRMKSYGPICLLKIGNETLLARQLRLINQTFNQAEVIVVGGFEAQKVKRELPKGVSFVENKYYAQTNVVHSISLGLTKTTTDRVLVVYGDLVFNPQTLKIPIYNKSSLVLCDTMKRDEVGCIVHNNTVFNMMYDLQPKWAQIAFLTGYELSEFKRLVTTKSCARMLGFEIMNHIITNNGTFHATQPKQAKVIDVDTSKDIIKAEEICTQ